VLPFSFRGEAELTRDVIQDAFDRVGIDGHLIVSTDNPRDRWLHDQLREMFPKVTVIGSEEAVVYVVKKRAEQKRPRPLKCEFAFRDGERLVRLVSRPGVFSHRRLDPGARQLIDAIPWPDRNVTRQRRCECSISVAVAERSASRSPCAPKQAIRGEAVPIEVLAIDSNARAVACTAESAELNAVNTLTARLSCFGEVDQPASYDLAVANPPYYADFRIAKLFVESAHKALAYRRHAVPSDKKRHLVSRKSVPLVGET
jgi:16S rRNA G1207 methylase RsmC